MTFQIDLRNPMMRFLSLNIQMVMFAESFQSNVNVGAGSEMNRSKKTQKARKSKPESEGVESSAGPVGQVTYIQLLRTMRVSISS